MHADIVRHKHPSEINTWCWILHESEMKGNEWNERERESERHMLSPIHFLSISNGTRIWSFSFSEESLSGSYITFFQLRLWYIYFFIVLFYSQFFSFLFCELQIVNHFLTGFSVPKLTRFCYMNIKLKILLHRDLDNVLLTYTIMNLC